LPKGLYSLKAGVFLMLFYEKYVDLFISPMH